jgi:hypothetical protein
VPTVWFEKNKNSLNLKFKPYNISCTGQTHKDLIQASEIHSELLFRHYSCYSDTRGVTFSKINLQIKIGPAEDLEEWFAQVNVDVF